MIDHILYCSDHDITDLTDDLEETCMQKEIRLVQGCSGGCYLFRDDGHPIYVVPHSGEPYTVPTQDKGMQRPYEDILEDIFTP